MSHVIERGVPSATDATRVVGVREGAGTVTVSWFCGESRTFSAQSLLDMVGHLDALSAFDDVWLHAQDAYGYAFYARVVDGELYANTSARERDGVPWRDMRKTLRRTAAAKALRERDEDGDGA